VTRGRVECSTPVLDYKCKFWDGSDEVRVAVPACESEPPPACRRWRVDMCVCVRLLW
jgi:hypothetical protein